MSRIITHGFSEIAYHDLLRRIMAEGERHDDRTGVGTKSVFGAQLDVDLNEGFPLFTTRKLPFRWIAEELLWMLSGSTDANELVEKGVHTWTPWATEEKCAKHGREQGDLGPTYGYLIRRFGGLVRPTKRVRELYGLMTDAEKGVDQLWDLAYLMDTEPNSRRLIVSQWDPQRMHTVTVPPCHPLWQVKLHGQDGISLRVDQRSADCFVGLAFDVAHYGLLLCLLAWCTNRDPRRLVFHIGDAHIYRNHVEQVKKLLGRWPRPLPQLEITKQMWHATPSAPGQDTFVNLLQFRYEHLSLRGYDPWPSMTVDVAV